MKLHRSRLAAGLALLVALPLTACSTPGAEPGVAARVGDRTVTAKDVETATSELAGLGLGQQFDTGAVTNYLALGPVLIEEFRKANITVGTAEARRMVRGRVGDVSAPTEEVLKTQFAAGRLQEAQQGAQQPGIGGRQAQEYQRVLQAGQAFDQQIQTYVREGRVDLNPKFSKQPVNWVRQENLTTPQQAPEQ